VSPAEVVETLITKGTALITDGRTAEAEVTLRGAIAVADRNGDLMASLRARNNILGVVEQTDLNEGCRIARESYEIANRFGQGTWVIQAIGVGRRLRFDVGEWDEWAAEMDAELAVVGPFFKAWFEGTIAQRMVYRGDPVEAEQRFREIRGRDIASDSVQMRTTNAADIGDALIGQGRWREAFEATRGGWDNLELGRYPVLTAIFASAAAGDAELMSQIPLPRPPEGLEMSMVEAIGEVHRTLTAAVEGRVDEARAGYLGTRRMLEAIGFRNALARFELALGHLASGRFPEAGDAAERAATYFRDRGAEAYVAAYLARASGPVEAASRPSAHVASDTRRAESSAR